MTADLVVHDATLRGRTGRWRIEVRDGQVAAIEPEGAGGPDGAVVLDARGALVTESFVDPHLHLCKVYTLDRIGDAALSAYTSGSMGAAMTAIELASVVKEQYAEGWIYANARRALLDGVRHGVLHVQAFADVDSRARLEGVKPLLRLRDEFADVVEVRVVAFPQDGLLRDEGAEEFVRAAVDLGADVVGGIPWIEHTDDEAREHVERMCGLAAARGCRIAMLVDDAGDPSLRTTEMLAAAMLRHGLVGRGVACHARAMGVWPEPYFRRLVGLVRRAGLGSSPTRTPARCGCARWS